MNFVSPEFAFAALVFFPVYWCLKPYRNAQMLFLTLAGYGFYASWSWISALLLLVYSLNIWVAGAWIAAADNPDRRRLYLSLAIILALPILLLTKYYEFLRLSLIQFLPQLGWQSLLPVIDFVVPAGVSFYTFQAITFLVWRFQKPNAKAPLLRTLLFLSFWPTLFSGPILRAELFFKQLATGLVGSPLQPARAIYYLLLGMTQKLVLANWLGQQWVDEVFRYADNQDLLSVSAAAWAYALQLFFDFAGYTLIVTGLALLLGYVLPVNFRQPYLAGNLREFWHRWHMSLSSFIRDYIYIPLGGNRLGFGRTQANILFAMVLSGLWHGANATFLIWGLLHGLGVVFVGLYERFCGWKLPRILSTALTLIYVTLAWIFFRADSTATAWTLLGGLATIPNHLAPDYLWLIASTLVFFALSRKAEALEKSIVGFFQNQAAWFAIPVSALWCYGVVLLGPNGVPGFIYYRF